MHHILMSFYDMPRTMGKYGSDHIDKSGTYAFVKLMFTGSNQ